MARIVPPQPISTGTLTDPFLLDEGLLPVLGTAVVRAARRGCDLLIATDGGADHHLSSIGYAAGVSTDSYPATHHIGIGGCDATPFTAELCAFLQCLIRLVCCADTRSVALFPARIVFLIDCKAVLDFVHRTHPPEERAFLWRSVRDAWTRLGARASLHLEWVPSHGKKLDWVPSDSCGHSGIICRKYNDFTDRACTVALQLLTSHESQLAWRRIVASAHVWTQKTLDMAALVSSAYSAWLRDWHAARSPPVPVTTIPRWMTTSSSVP